MSAKQELGHMTDVFGLLVRQCGGDSFFKELNEETNDFARLHNCTVIGIFKDWPKYADLRSLPMHARLLSFLNANGFSSASYVFLRQRRHMRNTEAHFDDFDDANERLPEMAEEVTRLNDPAADCFCREMLAIVGTFAAKLRRHT